MRPRLVRSILTDTIYITTRYVEKENGRYLIASIKYEITDDELRAVGLEKLPKIDEPDEPDSPVAPPVTSAADDPIP